MKQIISLFLCLQVAVNLYGQIARYQPYTGKTDSGYHTYGPAINFSNNLVADDFGLRKLIRNDHFVPYDWHGGIDYNGTPEGYGDIILAIEGGKIHEAGVSNQGLKWIVVQGAHNIVYEHIGTNGSIAGNGLHIEGCIIKPVLLAILF